MFLAICQEALGLEPEKVLNCDFVLTLSVLREHNYIINERNKQYSDTEPEGDFVEIIDFESGQKKRVRKVKSI